jgi:hypothetical protein
MIAILAVAAFGVSFNSNDVSAAAPGAGHSQANGLLIPHRHFPRHDHRTFAPYAGYSYMPYGDFTGADLSGMPDYSNYFTDPVGVFSMLRLIDHARPATAPSCKHSVETKTVPSEDGGERTITITRC